MNTNTALIKRTMVGVPIVIGLLAFLLSTAGARAQMELRPWQPIFKGVDQAQGTNYISTSGRRQVVHVLRLDLTDPDVRLLAEPPCTNCPAGFETRGRTTSGFLEAYKLQGAVNYSYFTECCSASAGTPMHVFGLLVSEGKLVSPAWTPQDVDPRNGQTYFSALMFATNNTPTFIPYNYPSQSLEGVYNAITGSDVLLNNGMPYEIDIAEASAPRVALGLSEDNRYLFLMVVDGRQPGYSDGASGAELAEWLRMVGAWNAINVDGGGSTTMVLSQKCTGKAVQVNRPIDGGVVGRERVVAGHFGFYAKPLSDFISDLKVEAGSTTATVTWSSLTPATTQVRYGLTTAYESSTSQDPNQVTSHTVELSGLRPGANYFLQAISFDGAAEHVAEACFRTTNFAGGILIPFNQVWKYAVENLDGISWQARNYNDATWPSGPGMLCIEDNPLVLPKGTTLPIDPSTTYPYITYYFRTAFVFTNDPVGTTLTFSNFLDDGAAFYLNGREIHRAYLPVGAGNQTLANNYHCRPEGDAICAYVFTLEGDILTNLVMGTNILAAEIHNFNARSPDIAFGTAVHYILPPPAPPMIYNMAVAPGESTATVTWNTRSNATSRVEYGLTSAMGATTPLNSTLATTHSLVLSNLLPLTNYHFKAVSTVGNTIHTAEGQFSTVPFFAPLMSMTQGWKFTTASQDGIDWTATGFDDSGWSGPGAGLLFVENNPDVAPKNTSLPVDPNQQVYPTYYFRTHFTGTNSIAGFAIQFSNYVDDGAVFYLNGREIQRLRMAENDSITYSNTAIASPQFGDAIYPDIFRVAGDALTNLLAGDNVLAVEVHQNDGASSDVVFGSAVALVRTTVAETPLRIQRNGNALTVAWEGASFTLQKAPRLNDPAAWVDVPGPVRTSPFTISNPQETTFFRLRN